MVLNTVKERLLFSPGTKMTYAVQIRVSLSRQFLFFHWKMKSGYSGMVSTLLNFLSYRIVFL